MVNQSALSDLKWCEENDIDVMTWGSLGAGILTGAVREKPNFDEKDFRATFYLSLIHICGPSAARTAWAAATARLTTRTPSRQSRL